MLERLARIADERDDLYGAIGRYFVQFSVLLARMRLLVAIKVLGKDRDTFREDPRSRLIELALGSLQAQQLADAFFSVCRATADPPLDDDERAIERCLRENHVNDEIRRRNVLAHGDWYVPEYIKFRDPTEEELDPRAELLRVRHHKSEPLAREVLRSPDVDAEGRRVELLERMIWEYGTICMRIWKVGPRKRIRDVFQLTGPANNRRVQLRES